MLTKAWVCLHRAKINPVMPWSAFIPIIDDWQICGKSPQSSILLVLLPTAGSLISACFKKMWTSSRQCEPKFRKCGVTYTLRSKIVQKNCNWWSLESVTLGFFHKYFISLLNLVVWAKDSESHVSVISFILTDERDCTSYCHFTSHHLTIYRVLLPISSMLLPLSLHFAAHLRC